MSKLFVVLTMMLFSGAIDRVGLDIQKITHDSTEFQSNKLKHERVTPHRY